MTDERSNATQRTIQRDLYDATCTGLIDDALRGVSQGVFAYGAAAAGKTHSLVGSLDARDLRPGDPARGIVPRVIEVRMRIGAGARASAIIMSHPSPRRRNRARPPRADHRGTRSVLCLRAADDRHSPRATAA